MIIFIFFRILFSRNQIFICSQLSRKVSLIKIVKKERKRKEIEMRKPEENPQKGVKRHPNKIV